MTLPIPERLRTSWSPLPEGRRWLARLPDVVGRLEARWALRVHAPFDEGEGSCAWVAPATCADGRRAVLKIGVPHMEAEHEADALRLWSGQGSVLLLDADEASGAMLLEACLPGTSLRARPDDEKDRVIAGLLRRLWRRPSEPHPFRPLSIMAARWIGEAQAAGTRWPDEGLAREGLCRFEELSRARADDVLLATDLHAGNVLAAEREPWLAIDPKPFVGDAAYDATQHLLDCERGLRTQPFETIGRFADLLDLDRARVQHWLFARAAVESRSDWGGEWLFDLARRIAST